MRIFVLGNINAGKTTVAKILSHELGTPILSIDAYRVKYGKGDIASEKEAQSRFIADIVATENAIVECTGLGKLGRDLRAALNDQNNLVVFIDTPEDECVLPQSEMDFQTA